MKSTQVVPEKRKGYRGVQNVMLALLIAFGSAPSWAADAVPDSSSTVAGASPPPADTAAATPISEETLDSLLAPIALYPDALLAQVLMASTYPMDVIEAARWQEAHPNVNGQALQEALAAQNWDPSVQSLVSVPQVLQYMNNAPRWMQDLGNAVMADQPRVMARVQVLRQKAVAAGKLTSNDKQTVQVTASGTSAGGANGVDAGNEAGADDGRYIAIAPASTQVIYVPVYDPLVVYGPWWWPTRPVFWGPPPGVAFTAGFYWGPRYYSSSVLWGGFNWSGGVITVNAPLYTSYYRRPPVFVGPNGAWWRPAPMYAPPFGGRYYHGPYRPPYDRYRPMPPQPRPPLYTQPRPPQTVQPPPHAQPQQPGRRPPSASPPPEGRPSAPGGGRGEMRQPPQRERTGGNAHQESMRVGGRSRE